MSDRYEFFLTCPKGLEGLLVEEATALGLEEAREQSAQILGLLLAAVFAFDPRYLWRTPVMEHS